MVVVLRSEEVEALLLGVLRLRRYAPTLRANGWDIRLRVG
jgi:hypothetical protein